MCLNVCGSTGEGALCSLVGQSELTAPVSPSWGALPWRGASPSVVLLSLSIAFLAEVLLRVSLSVNLFGLFPPPGVLRVVPDSGERFPWVVTFLFTDERVVVPHASSEGEGDLETHALGCPGAFSAGLLMTVLFGSKE